MIKAAHQDTGFSSRSFFESSWRPWEVCGVLLHFTGKQMKAQRSSVTSPGYTLGQDSARAWAHLSDVFCSPPFATLPVSSVPVQGSLGCCGFWSSLSPSCWGPESGWDPLGFKGGGDSCVRTLSRTVEDTLVGDHVSMQLPSREAGTEW